MKAVLLVLLGLTVSAFGSCGATEPTWKLAWSDEFDGTKGAPPDANNWVADIGTGIGGWGNNQWEYDRAENATLDGDGHLVIASRLETFEGKPYTSARLKTKGLFTRTYGKFEARMKLAKGQGLWPAFWMLGSDIDQVGWPTCGEIDIMESKGLEPQRIAGSLHGPGYSGGNPITSSYVLPGGATFDQDFHVFGLEWTPDYIAWQLDGVTWQVVVPAELPKGTRWVFDHPFYMLLNVAVGGNYVGNPDPNAFLDPNPPHLPVDLLTVIDYVRVYERVP
jgi:beta-glucanase (GH16 family)